jgi:hypothetical protein
MSLPQQDGQKLGLRSQTPRSSQVAMWTVLPVRSLKRESQEELEHRYSGTRLCLYSITKGTHPMEPSDHEVTPALSLYTKGSWDSERSSLFSLESLDYFLSWRDSAREPWLWSPVGRCWGGFFLFWVGLADITEPLWDSALSPIICSPRTLLDLRGCFCKKGLGAEWSWVLLKRSRLHSGFVWLG